MDEQRLRELFQDAVRDTPPASFGRDEVVTAARRATARRRAALAGGTGLGVVVLAGALLVGGQLLPGQTPAAQQAAPQPDSLEASEPHILSAPSDADADPLSPRADAADATMLGCGPVDQELVADVGAVLAEREIAVTGPATESPVPCPDGWRSAGIPLPGGTLYVLVLPRPGTPESGAGPEFVEQPDPAGAVGRPVMLDDDRLLMVSTVSAVPGQPAPLAGELPALTDDLAARL